jgi:hypothetical protein
MNMATSVSRQTKNNERIHYLVALPPGTYAVRVVLQKAAEEADSNELLELKLAIHVIELFAQLDMANSEEKCNTA